MIVLDTDHLSILLNRRASSHSTLHTRLSSANDSLSIPIVCVEEQCRGWLALINRTRTIHAQLTAYENFRELIQFFRKWDILPMDVDAADRLEVADMAGNLAQHVSPQPLVIDMSEPRPTVLNVSGGPR